MLSPGRYLEKALRRDGNRSQTEVARLIVMELVRAGGTDEFNLDYRVEAQLELAKMDLEVLPPAFARVYAEIVGFDADTYFELVNWFEAPGWNAPPNICRACGADPDADFDDGVCGRCQRQRKNRQRIAASHRKQFERLAAPAKRISS